MNEPFVVVQADHAKQTLAETLDEAIWRYEARFDGARPAQLQVPIDTTPLLSYCGIPLVGVTTLHMRGGLWQVAAGPAPPVARQAPLWPGPAQLALRLEERP